MKKGLVGAIVASIILVGCYLLFGPDGQVQKNAYGFVETNVSSNTSYACKGLASGNLYPDIYKKEVNATVEIGSDEVALVVKDENTLVMSTSASIKAGVAEGDQMRILDNDENKLTAVWYGGDSSGVISAIAINKKNGLAVWTKANSDFALLGAPSGQAVYMSCI